jgi:hypothetical protein
LGIVLRQKTKIPHHAAKKQNFRRKNAANNPRNYRKYFQAMASYKYMYKDWTDVTW